MIGAGGVQLAYDGAGNRVRRTDGANVTQYLLDLQPGLAVVLAATTAANTDRYVHGSRGIHAQKDAAGNWEYPVQDGLGSVRGAADNAMLWSAHYDPFGTSFGAAGTEQTSYGFTGEQYDPLTDLLYLRARHYKPGLGQFTALDPFEGAAIRPMSMNGNSWVGWNPVNGAVGELLSLNSYAYVNGNPVNLVDRRGMIPNRPEIASQQPSDPTFLYSCNCGWIDWDHANPQITAVKVLAQVGDAVDYFKQHPQMRRVAISGQDIEHRINVPGLGAMVTYPYNVVFTSALNESNWLGVAMAIFREVEHGHENSNYSLLSLVTIPINPNWTFFSEEDLSSDLIAFYRALDRDNFDPVNAFNTLTPICDFPRNFTDARDWTLQAFDSYGSFQHVGEWEIPRLHSTPEINQRCGTATRSWPQALRSIQPIYDNSIWIAEPRLPWWRIGPYYAQMNPNGTLDMLPRSSKSGPPYLGSTVSLSPTGVVSVC